MTPRKWWFDLALALAVLAVCVVGELLAGARP